MVTLVFTDIEGSSLLWEREPERMSRALARHDEVVRTAIGSHRGTVVKMLGDGVNAVFDDSLDALNATLAIQHALTDFTAADGLALQIRCGLHAGPVERRDSDFFGGHVNRAARIMNAAHGGQVLVSQAVADHVRDRLPPAISLRDLGHVRLRDLARPERVFQVVDPRLRQDFPALRSLESTPNNLPEQLTSFVGRDDDIAQVRQRLHSARLLTLLGPGGIGKTRLSLQAAADVLDDFPHGAWLVELAPLTDPSLVTQTVAQVLGVREQPGATLVSTLAAHLKPLKLLLVIDNCEHLVAACAELVQQLLQHAPGLRVLASSREPLRIAGEHAYSLPPLAVPDGATRDASPAAESPAVRLFVDRARQQQPGFALGVHNVAAVIEICRRLDGIPLALELAAARVRAMSVETIVERLADRFRLLTGGSRTALPRQQTLHALIEWSYELLSVDERSVFTRLATFAGGCTLAAAEAVCSGEAVAQAAVLDALAGLVDKSLALCQAGTSPPRYAMLETIRMYAAEKLAQSPDHDETRDRHLDFYLALANGAREQLRGATFAQGIGEIERERENLLAAQAWCTLAPERAGHGLRLVFDLQGYWDQRAQYASGLRLATVALSQAGAAPPTRERGAALLTASLLAYRMGRYDEAQKHAEEAVAILRNTAPDALFADALIRLAHPLVAVGDVAAAQHHLEERLALVRAMGDERRIASTVNALAELHRLNGNLALAVPLYEEALRLAQDACDPPTLAVCQLNVALVSVMSGDWARAARLLHDVLRLVGEFDFKRVAGIALDVAFAIAVARGQCAWGARLLGASEAHHANVGYRRDPADAASIAAFTARAQAGLGEAAFAAAYAAGRALRYDEALAATLAWLSAAAGGGRPASVG